MRAFMSLLFANLFAFYVIAADVGDLGPETNLPVAQLSNNIEQLEKRVPHPTWRQHRRIRHLSAMSDSPADFGAPSETNGRMAGFYDYAFRPLFMRYNKREEPVRRVHILPLRFLETILNNGRYAH